MRGSAYSPTSQTSDYSDVDPSASKRLSSENFSVILNIDKTVAKSRQIIQESLEVSRKNNERRQQLEERLKTIVTNSENSSRVDIVPKAYDDDPEVSRKVGVSTTDLGYSADSIERSRSGDVKYRYDEEQMSREKTEAQITELRKRLSYYEHLDIDVDKLKSELKETREELRKERLKNRDMSDFGVTKSKELTDTIKDLEATIRRLKTDVDRRQDENLALERSVRTADEQRAELLRESELLRQTLADLKKLHLRELEEMEKRLDEAIRDKTSIERQLVDARDEQKGFARKEQDSLQGQVSSLEGKLRELEVKYTHQMTVNQELQTQVQSLCRDKSPPPQAPEKLVQVFETQMHENTRRIQELQHKLNESTAKQQGTYDSDSEGSLSSEELRAMIRKQQKELGLAEAQRPKHPSKRHIQKAKEIPRPHSSVTRRRNPAKADPPKRTYSRCKYCQE